ncbi:uncharacterized protein ACOB8E_000711 isoform 3-T3 [Sarcophilus harrisii]
MAQRNGVSPQDLVQEQKKNPFKKAKWMMFRGPPHRLAPSSKNNKVQQLDLKGQLDSLPTRPKMEVKDVRGPSCVRSLPSTIPNNLLAFPLIKREPLPPVSFKSHPKATLDCLGQRVDAAPERTSKIHSTVATECQTSSKRVLEPSSLGPRGEASADQGVTPVSAMKRCSSLWKRSMKISPAVPTECQTASRDLSEPSFDWAQGETSPVSTIKAISGPCKRKPKIYPAMTHESKASQKVVSEPSTIWLKGENPPLQEVLRVSGIKGVSAPRKKTNVYPTLPIISKKYPKVETSSNWPQREASHSVASKWSLLGERRGPNCPQACQPSTRHPPKLSSNLPTICSRNCVLQPKKVPHPVLPKPVVPGRREPN